MVLACDLLLGALGTCAVPAMPASSCSSSLLPGPVSVCPSRLLDTGQGRAGVPHGTPTPLLSFPGSPLPHSLTSHSPLTTPAVPPPHLAHSAHVPRPCVLSDRTGACLSPCGLCVSGQLLEVIFVIVDLCALSALLGGPSRTFLSQSIPHFTRTPMPCLDGFYGAAFPSHWAVSGGQSSSLSCLWESSVSFVKTSRMQ